MKQLYFLIIVFFIAIGLSLYFAKEGFDNMSAGMCPTGSLLQNNNCVVTLMDTQVTPNMTVGVYIAYLTLLNTTANTLLATAQTTFTANQKFLSDDDYLTFSYNGVPLQTNMLSVSAVPGMRSSVPDLKRFTQTLQQIIQSTNTSDFNKYPQYSDPTKHIGDILGGGFSNVSSFMNGFGNVLRIARKYIHIPVPVTVVPISVSTSSTVATSSTDTSGTTTGVPPSATGTTSGATSLTGAYPSPSAESFVSGTSSSASGITGVPTTFLCTVAPASVINSTAMSTGPSTGPSTGAILDPATGAILDPATGTSIPAPSTGAILDPATGAILDPATGTSIPTPSTPVSTTLTKTTSPANAATIQNHIDDLISALSTNQVNTPSQLPPLQDPSVQPSPSASGQDISSTPAPLTTTPSTPDTLSSYYNILGTSTNQPSQPPTVLPSAPGNTISPSIAQGADWRSACPKMPDMSQYIKKDAIPCWGCTVNY